MSDTNIRIEGRAGRVTLNRPEALNALTHPQCLAIEAALDDWRGEVDLVIFDAAGDRAFCAGGDIADMYTHGLNGDPTYSRQFWRDEYRMNAKIAEYPHPIVSFLQGFTMGGGVGLGCHASHRIVCETSQIAMPECSIGLVPDVGGSWILAKAPGRLGAFLGITGTRLGPHDAIYAGFADQYVPHADWDRLKADLIETADVSQIAERSTSGTSDLVAEQDEIDTLFASSDLSMIWATLQATETPLAGRALKAMSRNAPLAMASALKILDRLRPESTIRDALSQEFLYTSRSVEQGDFIEGIRAMIIDKDRSPKWAYPTPDALPSEAVDAMVAPLPDEVENWENAS